MKSVSLCLVSLLACLLIVGCPSRNQNAPANGNAFEGEKYIEDGKYGTMSLLDKKRLGDHDVSIYSNEWRSGDAKDNKDPALRIVVSGGDPEKRKVRAWLADSQGNKITSQVGADWNKSDGNFLCKFDLKEKPVKAGTYKLWVAVDEAEDSWEISVK